jgi:hypothetical protein
MLAKINPGAGAFFPPPGKMNSSDDEFSGEELSAKLLNKIGLRFVLR